MPFSLLHDYDDLVIGDVRAVAADGDFTDIDTSILVILCEQFTKFANRKAIEIVKAQFVFTAAT
jgi:hypothetical protein